MRFIFWQNTNSIHQSEFFNALAKTGAEVILIVTVPIPKRRTEMGWSEPTLENVEVIHAYNSQFDVPAFISQNRSRECFHIFSGISAFPLVHQAFKYAIKLKCRVGVFSEPLDFRGFKGKLRRLRGVLHKFLWGARIEVILATGSYGVKQFTSWGYSRENIFEWAYTVKKSSNTICDSPKADNRFKIMFAGSLIKRKGYDVLIDALQILNKSIDFKMDLFCLSQSDTELGNEILRTSGLHDCLELLPFLPNSELRKQMNDYDLFVLPSRHDGWGAVVSESLMEGTPVVVTSACGSSSQVVRNKTIGKVVKSNNVNELAKALGEMIGKGKLDLDDRMKNRRWAETHISGENMAVYFNEIMSYTNDTSETKPLAPWQK